MTYQYFPHFVLDRKFMSCPVCILIFILFSRRVLSHTQISEAPNSTDIWTYFFMCSVGSKKYSSQSCRHSDSKTKICQHLFVVYANFFDFYWKYRHTWFVLVQKARSKRTSSLFVFFDYLPFPKKLKKDQTIKQTLKKAVVFSTKFKQRVSPNFVCGHHKNLIPLLPLFVFVTLPQAPLPLLEDVIFERPL